MCFIQLIPTLVYNRIKPVAINLGTNTKSLFLYTKVHRELRMTYEFCVRVLKHSLLRFTVVVLSARKDHAYYKKTLNANKPYLHLPYVVGKPPYPPHISTLAQTKNLLNSIIESSWHRKIL